jgi:hypothetical protein
MTVVWGPQTWVNGWPISLDEHQGPDRVLPYTNIMPGVSALEHALSQCQGLTLVCLCICACLLPQVDCKHPLAEKKEEVVKVACKDRRRTL